VKPLPGSLAEAHGLHLKALSDAGQLSQDTGLSRKELDISPAAPCRVGIDPGLTGAVAFLWGGGRVDVFDIPVLPRLSGKGTQVNARQLYLILNTAPPGALVYFEQVNPMPGQGVTSMFHFGRTVGVIEGVLGSLGLPYEMVRPQVWKKGAGLLKKEKDASRTLALQLYPQVSDKLARKKDNGRAEAILIARYGAG